MKRRIFLAAALAAATLPGAALAGGWVEYTKGNQIKAALAQGKTVLVDYAADWCSTCARQERVINALRSEDAAYDENIVFVRVDWDDFRNDPVAVNRNIPRRSTLIVLNGKKELGRIVAGTSHSQIKALMDKAVSAAKSS